MPRLKPVPAAVPAPGAPALPIHEMPGHMVRRLQQVAVALFTSPGTSTSANYPASGADTAGGNSGCSWGSPANVGSGASTTSCNVAANATGNASSHFLYASNFGFAIPSDATITGITLEIRRNAAATSALVDNVVRLAKTNNQTNLGTSFANATTWPSTLTTQTYGDAAALWGTTWTPAEINASTFGAVLSVSNATGTARSATVDWFRITVAYTFSTAPDRKSTRLNSSH